MGLLDQDQWTALGTVGAGLLNRNFAGGALAAMQGLDEAKKRKLQEGLLGMQMQNYASEIDARKLKTTQDARQQSMIEGLFPGLLGGSPGSQPATPGAPAGAAMGGVPGAPAGAPGGGQPGPQNILALSQQLGIPPEAIKTDLIFNGGKGIGEMLYKRGTPDMQVTNGYAFDKNRVGAGFMPFLSTSTSGQTSMGRIGPDGLPVVSAPQGAMDTYTAYQNAEQGAKANFDPVTVTPAGQPPQMTTRGALVRNPQVQGSIPAGVQAGRDTDRTAILQQELTKAQGQYQAALQAGDQSAAARAQTDIAALQREMGGRTATVGMPLASDEDKLRGQKGVEGDAKTNEARATDVKTAQRFLSVAKQASEVLKQGPTSSGIGAAVDSAAGLVGYATPGAVSAQRLTALGGWLTANVPRMEGPQSNFDVGNYQRMAADVGNPMLPLKRRQAALDTITQMMQGIVESGGIPNKGGATGSFDAPKAPVIDQLPKTAPKGQKVRDTQTGKVLQFNGLSWVEVK